MQSVGRVGSLSGESPDTRSIAKALAGQRFACHLPPSVGLSGSRVVVLAPVAVPGGQLLAVGRGTHGVEAEGQVVRAPVEGGHEPVEADVAQPLEGLDGDGILEARQRRLAGRGIRSRAEGDSRTDPDMKPRTAITLFSRCLQTRCANPRS